MEELKGPPLDQKPVWLYVCMYVRMQLRMCMYTYVCSVGSKGAPGARPLLFTLYIRNIPEVPLENVGDLWPHSRDLKNGCFVLSATDIHVLCVYMYVRVCVRASVCVRAGACSNHLLLAVQ